MDHADKVNDQDHLDKYMCDTTIVRGLSRKGSHEWLIAYKEEYNLVTHAKMLSKKKILLMGSWKDDLALIYDHTLPFYRALQKSEAQFVKIVVFDMEHSFCHFRKDLYRTVYI